MAIDDFIKKFTNYPVLFLGTGFSLRYLKNSYTWDGLLSKVCEDIWGDDEHYLDIKASYSDGNGNYRYAPIASEIEQQFNDSLKEDRNGKFKDINDIFYDTMRQERISVSRFKLYISKLLSNIDTKEEVSQELQEFKQACRNVSSIITTNYDTFIENFLEFKPLVGNNILLSNPYGSVYKIHGCVNDVSQMIITEEDYKRFDERYELIRAQMLSLFIHNPIIFIGYSMGDENIKKVLKTIFTYIPTNTSEAEDIRNNFLLVEYDKGSTNLEVTDHDIDINGDNIRIHKLKTDNYSALYRALSCINLPISAMDVRKVQNIVREITTGGSIKVMIMEDWDDMRNTDRVLAIGSSQSVTYKYVTISDMIQNYFTIMDNSDAAVLSLLDKQKITNTQYFPVFGFSTICHSISKIEHLKEIQQRKVSTYIREKCQNFNTQRQSITAIMNDATIAPTYKHQAILCAFNFGAISLDDMEQYLRNYTGKKETDYRRLLCLYDMKKYNTTQTE